MRTVAIVQARLGSTRLPGKVLADLCGDTMLARVVQRLRAAHRVDDVVIATTLRDEDDLILDEAKRLGVGVFRGSEHDVLARYLGAARAFHAGIVVRVTSDCPLLDPWVVDDVIWALRAQQHNDYASNTHTRTYPRGLDVEALYLETLARIDACATSVPAREHVTAYLMEQPGAFTMQQVQAKRDDSDLRWTVDTQDDLALARLLYERLGLAHTIRPYSDVVAAVRAMPELTAINAHVTQKPWQQVSRVA